MFRFIHPLAHAAGFSLSLAIFAVFLMFFLLAFIGSYLKSE